MSTMEDRMSQVERTLQEIAAINRELQERHRELQEKDREWQEKDREWREQDREWREKDREWREKDREMQERNRELQEERHRVRQEADRAREEKENARWEAEQTQRDADRRAYEEEKRLAQRKWGEMANKMGTLVEDIVAPGIPTVFRNLFGLDRLEADAQRMHRTHRRDRSREREFDYVVAAGDVLLITETKSTLRPEDIPDFVAALREARDYLPEFSDKRIVGALASFSVHPTLVVAGERQGLLMFGLGTGLLQVLNTPGFQPTRF
jgi:hypothetical protein